MHRRAAILTVCFLSGCTVGGTKAKLGPGDLVDTGTTAIGLSSGFVEANPTLSSFGQGAPLAAITLKYAMRVALIEAGYDPRQVNRGIEASSWVGGCANIATMAGVTFVPAIVIGLTCATVYLDATKG